MQFAEVPLQAYFWYDDMVWCKTAETCAVQEGDYASIPFDPEAHIEPAYGSCGEDLACT